MENTVDSTNSNVSFDNATFDNATFDNATLDIMRCFNINCGILNLLHFKVHVNFWKVHFILIIKF